jgi:TetR/AcrR family transcriptional regulator, transcriptional repressor for nem operon
MTNVKRTREDILDSVLELIHRQGFQSTGLKELFAASNSSSGSFYNYFGSKDELGHALIDFKWSKIKARILQPFSDRSYEQDPIALTFAIIDLMEASHLEEIDCSGCLLGNFIVDLAEHNPSFRIHLTRIFDEWQGIIAKSLDRAKSQLKPNSEPEFLAEEILTVMEGVLLMNRLYANQDRLKRGFNAMRNLVKASLA